MNRTVSSFHLAQKEKLGSALRAEFPVFQNNKKKFADQTCPFVYLDSAASSQKHKTVIEAMTQYLEHDYGPAHRGSYGISMRSTELYESAREKVARFTSPSLTPEQVIFTKGTTESLNLLANGFAQTILDEQSRIVITVAEHHANFIPWQQAALKKDCEIAYINFKGTKKEHLALDLAEAGKMINRNTKIVSFAYVGNLIGQINAVPELIDMAKNVGARVVIDCAQSMSCFPDDLFALGADAIVFSPHKIHGPTGIGVLALSKDLMEELPPLLYGGGMVSHVSLEESRWVQGPAKFEAGSPPVAEAVGLSAAITWLEKVGRQRIHEHSASLASLFMEKIQGIKDIEVFSPCTGKETLVSFRHKQLHAHDLATILDNHNIAMRAGHHCAWPLIHFLGVDALVRASFAAYSDSDDVFAAVDAIKNAVHFISSQKN